MDVLVDESDGELTVQGTKNEAEADRDSPQKKTTHSRAVKLTVMQDPVDAMKLTNCIRLHTSC